MRRLHLERSGENHPWDVTRVQNAIINHGFRCSRREAQRAWELYSDALCAGWLMLPADDAAIWKCVEEFIEEL